jgi:hypothetical protein
MKWPSLTSSSPRGGPFGAEPAGPPRPFGGDPFGGGPGGGNPFARAPARASPDDSPKSDKGTIVVDDAGEYYQGQMKLFLPFVMTPLGLLVIEPLSDGQPVWHRERVVTLTGGEERQDASPFGGFHPSAMDPFAPPGAGQQRPRQAAKVLTAMERYEYRLGESTADTVVLHKSYSLETLQARDDQLRLNVTGKAQIVFDKTQGIPQSMTSNMEFVSQQQSASIKIPVEFSYEQAGS